MASDKEKDNPASFENQAVAIAEQLGRIAGTIEGTAEQWMNRQAVSEQLARVRDSASQLIESLSANAAKGQVMTGQVRTAAAKAVSAASSAAASLGTSVRKMSRVAAKSSTGKKTAGPAKPAKPRVDLAHAPGKKHRKPAPSMHGAKKSDERIPKARGAAAARQRRKSYA